MKAGHSFHHEFMNKNKTSPDEKFIAEAKAGNKRAFGKLIKKHQKQVLYLAFDLIGNYEDAKDLAQDVFIKSFEKIGQFQHKAEFSTWIYRITVNLAMDFHRKKKRRSQRLLDQPLVESHQENWSGSNHPSFDPVVRMENRDELDKTINQLSMNQRTATVLKYFHHRTTKEIAEMMGCTESTVRNHLFRALANMKRLMENKK